MTPFLTIVHQPKTHTVILKGSCINWNLIKSVNLWHTQSKI
jgi:hypothetical protein